MKRHLLLALLVVGLLLLALGGWAMQGLLRLTTGRRTRRVAQPA
jgi:hypothetical protein